MCQTMKMSEIIDKVSELYREELSHHKDIRIEYNEVCKKLLKADHDGGKNITYDEYQKLKARKIALQQSLSCSEEYCNGIHIVRELLMDLGFDTEVT